MFATLRRAGLTGLLTDAGLFCWLLQEEEAVCVTAAAPGIITTAASQTTTSTPLNICYTIPELLGSRATLVFFSFGRLT